MRWTGQTLMVVGGTSGVGLATAQAAAEVGAQVIIVGRDGEKLDRAVAAIGGEARGERVDASDRDALDALFTRTGRFDHLVIAASGGIGAGPLATLARGDLERGLNGKFWVQWQCTQAALSRRAPR